MIFTIWLNESDCTFSSRTVPYISYSYTSCLFKLPLTPEKINFKIKNCLDSLSIFQIIKMSIKTGIASALTLLGTFISFYIVYALLTNQLFLLDIGWLLTAFGPIYWASLGKTQYKFWFTIIFKASDLPWDCQLWAQHGEFGQQELQ